MSIFISCIPAAGFSEMPPVSKVTPLPTRPSVGPRSTAAGVAQHDQRRVLVRARGDGEQAAHPLALDLVAAEHLDARPTRGRRRSRSARAARKAGSATLAGRFCRSRARLAASAATRAVSAIPVAVVGAEQRQRLELRVVGLVGVVATALEAVEAVGAEDRARGQRRPRRSRRSRARGRPRRSSAASKRRACRVAERRRDPGALGVEAPRARRGRRPGPGAGGPAAGSRAILNLALASLGARGGRELGGQVVALEETDAEQVGIDVGGELSRQWFEAHRPATISADRLALTTILGAPDATRPTQENQPRCRGP